MKHEPRPAIHMEKQLGWAYKLGGLESQGISKARQTVLQVDGVSAMGRRGSEKGQWPAFLSGRRLSPTFLLDAGHFSFSLYATGAF